MSQLIQAVLFDAVGTVIYPHPPAAEVYAAYGRRHGSAFSEAEVLRRFHHAFAGQEHIDSQAGNTGIDETRERNRWRSIVAEVLPDAKQPESLFESLWNHFRRAKSWAVFDDVSPCLQALRDSGIQVGIASNFDHRLVEICRELPPFDRDFSVFVSSQLGRRKPHPEFFDAIRAQLKLAATQILMVGDNWTTDVEGARNTDWQAVCIDRQAAASTTDVLRRLTDLPAWLSGQAGRTPKADAGNRPLIPDR